MYHYPPCVSMVVAIILTYACRFLVHSRLCVAYSAALVQFLRQALQSSDDILLAMAVGE